MYLADHARETPDKAALIVASTGQKLTFAELDGRSTRLARFLQQRGLKRGDHLALLMENSPAFMEVVWAAYRSGFHITAINRHLPPEDVAFIVGDCGAKAIISSTYLADAIEQLAPRIPTCNIRLITGGMAVGWQSYADALASVSGEPLAQEWMGEAMLYSSGTTGRPKGILRPLRNLHPSAAFAQNQANSHFGFGTDTIYLSPAPLYHAAPFSFALNVQAAGGTVVIMEHFDAQQALQFIMDYRVTHSQWVPTMFIRMLKLPPETRACFDASSMKVAIHAAAPCPVDIKQQMIDWWGPILWEYYSGTEGIGQTLINSKDWLSHRGSVGRATLGTIRICDPDGHELAASETGNIYFERCEPVFEYNNDPGKTAESRHPVHPNWATMGDIGYLDADGFLYLTDRNAFMIISGGVNIYPQMVEDALITHPWVEDVAVIGVPDEEMGEVVKAIVRPVESVEPSEELVDELRAYARARVAGFMVPRSVDFIAEMPRLPTGKLYKKALLDSYRLGTNSD